MIGSFCELNKVEPITDLKKGMDFRHPVYRREVFLRFYDYHLKYKAHAGAVYYVMPYLFSKYHMSDEEKYWLCFINGCSQNIITSYIIFINFPSISELDEEKLTDWFYRYYNKLGWDTDRRYFKNSFVSDVIHYKKLLAGRKQKEYFDTFCIYDKPELNFDALWDEVLVSYKHFGRLSTFSYLEYLRIAGLNIDCSNLFLHDLKGSKSHRNGLCKVLGRDDLDWHGDNVPEYDLETLSWLKEEAKLLLDEAKQRNDHKDVSYFTLETTLCCYKGWFRVNRRYPNVYNDMFYDRIIYAEKEWRREYDINIFWESRKRYLPKYLRLEDNPDHYGLCIHKQNHFRLTGEVIMMDQEHECFANNLGTKIQTKLFNEHLNHW
jgi:hypothetical protein